MRVLMHVLQIGSAMERVSAESLPSSEGGTGQGAVDFAEMLRMIGDAAKEARRELLDDMDQKNREVEALTSSAR
jgi:hypothetical protein